MRRFTLFLLTIMLLTAWVTSIALADDDRSRRTLSGTVYDVNLSDYEFRVRFDNNARYLIRADEARVTTRGRNANIRDIRKGDKVKIYGDVRSGGTMDAYNIEILNGSDRYDGYDRHDRWEQERRSGLEPGRIVTISGRVNGMDSRRGWVQLDTNIGNIKILAGNGVIDVRESGRKRSVKDIRDGDYLTVTGKALTHAAMTANTININDSDRGRNYDLQTVLMGEVTDEAGKWDRNLRVRIPVGERTVSVARDARVTRAGRLISVHDINSGENIKAVGSWKGNIFSANQLDVASGRGDEGNFYGKIERIDYDDREFRVKVGRRGYRVEAGNAQVTDDGRRMSFHDLRNGQEVRVYGDLRGDVIYADRIDRGGYYSRSGKDYRP